MNKIIKLLTAAALLTSAAIAHAIPYGTYTLKDHPDAAFGSATNPYGLRMDDLGIFFSVERDKAKVTLTWDASGATIDGTLYDNATGTLWSVSQNITGVVDDFSGAVQGFRTNDEIVPGNIMTLTNLDTNASYTYSPKSNGSYSFLFLNDGHRCGGFADCGPIVARGWFQNRSGTQIGTNDWLVQAVPAPGVVLMLAAGLIAVSFSRKLIK